MTAETDTPEGAGTGILKGRGDVVVTVAAVVTGEARGLLGKRPEGLEAVRMTFLLPRGSGLQRRL